MAILDLADAIRELTAAKDPRVPVDRTLPSPGGGIAPRYRYIADCFKCEVYDVGTDERDLKCGECRQQMRVTLPCGCSPDGCICRRD